MKCIQKLNEASEKIEEIFNERSKQYQVDKVGLRLFVNPETAAEWVTSLMGIDLQMKGEYLIQKNKA